MNSLSKYISEKLKLSKNSKLISKIANIISNYFKIEFEDAQHIYDTYIKEIPDYLITEYFNYAGGFEFESIFLCGIVLVKDNMPPYRLKNLGCTSYYTFGGQTKIYDMDEDLVHPCLGNPIKEQNSLETLLSYLRKEYDENNKFKNLFDNDVYPLCKKYQHEITIDKLDSFVDEIRIKYLDTL